MPAGTEAHQLVEVCQVGTALIILSFKPCQIDQQLAWSWLTCIGGNRHISPPLTVLTLRHRVRLLEKVMAHLVSNPPPPGGGGGGGGTAGDVPVPWPPSCPPATAWAEGAQLNGRPSPRWGEVKPIG